MMGMTEIVIYIHLFLYTCNAGDNEEPGSSLTSPRRFAGGGDTDARAGSSPAEETRRASYSFLYMSEFDYGQRALFGEPCDYKLYMSLVRKPIFQEAADSSDDSSRYKVWVAAQHDYSRMLQQNLRLRALTCHADHLMQCSENVTATGNHTCECLQLPPYNLTLDSGTGQCRASDGARCYSPFGYHCLTGAVCRQTANPSGECECVRLTGTEQLKDNCSGYKEDYEAGHRAMQILKSGPKTTEREEPPTLLGIKWPFKTWTHE